MFRKAPVATVKIAGVAAKVKPTNLLYNFVETGHILR